MANENVAREFRIVPAADLSDYYAAGYDGNHFATAGEAEAALENLLETIPEWRETEWTIVEVAS